MLGKTNTWLVQGDGGKKIFAVTTVHRTGVQCVEVTTFHMSSHLERKKKRAQYGVQQRLGFHPRSF
jgi:hypothetical protein